MTVTSLSATLACLLFVGAMAIVIYTDLRTREIHNKLIVVMLGTYIPMAIASGGDFETIGFSLIIAVPVLVLGFLCFSAGWMGGGDAKLMPVTALWLGPALAVPYLLYSAVLGSVLALGVVAYRTAVSAGPVDGAQEPKLEIPYGPALALSGAFLFLQSWWVGQL